MHEQTGQWGEDELVLTEHVSVLRGEANGAYPSGNSVVVKGASEALIIDPSVTVVSKGGATVPIDLVLNSHGHEDHMPGNGLFTDARLGIHDDDLHAAHSLDGLLDIYGLEGTVRSDFATTILTEFNYAARPDA
ncbi:MAG: MBL fold metallo-hydrolase, partial [Acidimicrobiales bacterium]